jgi:DNA-binding GntR family transcriptional regulator
MEKSKSLSDKVFDEIRKEILSGILKPGDALLEREWALRMDVSRVPVREALIRLEGKGLVKLVKGRGGIVRTLGAQEIGHLYEMRQALEAMAARLAAGHIAPSKLQEIEDALAAFKPSENQEDLARLRSVNADLHATIAANCGNPLLQRALSDIADQVAFSRTYTHPRLSMPDVLVRLEDHFGIIRALKSGDGMKAEEAMRAHFERWHTINL